MNDKNKGKMVLATLIGLAESFGIDTQKLFDDVMSDNVSGDPGKYNRNLRQQLDPNDTMLGEIFEKATGKLAKDYNIQLVKVDESWPQDISVQHEFVYTGTYPPPMDDLVYMGLPVKVDEKIPGSVIEVRDGLKLVARIVYVGVNKSEGTGDCRSGEHTDIKRQSHGT